MLTASLLGIIAPLGLQTPPTPPPDAPIAYVAKVDQNWDIYTVRTDGTGRRRLTISPATDHNPHWSPDGSMLFFASDRADDNTRYARFAMRADGADAHEAPPFKGVPEFFPAINPLDGRLAFTATIDGQREIMIADTDGANARLIAPSSAWDGDPRWSPDGARLLFRSDRDGDHELYVVDADGSNLRQLTDNTALDRYARWSPDGTRIAFCSARDDGETLEIYVMDADGRNPVRLTTNDVEDGEVRFSPDGTWLVFHSNRTGEHDIYIMPSTGGEAINLTNTPGVYEGEPAWSPAVD